jgi:hypothetical protein
MVRFLLVKLAHLFVGMGHESAGLANARSVSFHMCCLLSVTLDGYKDDSEADSSGMRHGCSGFEAHGKNAAVLNRDLRMCRGSLHRRIVSGRIYISVPWF